MRIRRHQLKRLLSYNPATGKWHRLTHRRGCSIERPVGALRKDGRYQIQVNGYTYLSNVLAWFYMTGKWPKKIIDHKNRIRSDDRWTNLREGTQGQNVINSPIRSNNTSGFTGIRERNGGFQAILANRSLGTFPTIERAIEVRKQEAKRIYGEFADE